MKVIEDESSRTTAACLAGGRFCIALHSHGHEGPEIPNWLAEVLEEADGHSIQLRPTLVEFGMGATGVEVLAVAVGGLTGLIVLFNGLAEAIPRARQLWTWMASLRHRIGVRAYGIEVLKLAVVDELVGVLGGTDLPSFELMRTTTDLVSWRTGYFDLAEPIVFLVPDFHRECTHLLAMDAQGSVLHRTKLPLFEGRPHETDQGREYLPLGHGEEE